jgi:hypothetical protein
LKKRGAKKKRIENVMKKENRPTKNSNNRKSWSDTRLSGIGW